MKQLMGISDEMTTEQFEKALKEYDPKDIIDYLVEDHKETQSNPAEMSETEPEDEY